MTRRATPKLDEAIETYGILTATQSGVDQVARSEPLIRLPTRTTGRPDEFSDAIAQEIINRVEGGETLARIVKDPHMPCHQSVFKWLDLSPAFATAYANARARQAAAIAEHGYEQAQADLAPQDVNRARLRFDSAKWLASKIDPSRWSEKSEAHVTVSDGASSERRAELVAALQRLAVAAPLIEGAAEPPVATNSPSYLGRIK
jgi:hypothetical protein